MEDKIPLDYCFRIIWKTEFHGFCGKCSFASIHLLMVDQIPLEYCFPMNSMENWIPPSLWKMDFCISSSTNGKSNSTGILFPHEFYGKLNSTEFVESVLSTNASTNGKQNSTEILIPMNSMTNWIPQSLWKMHFP